MPEHARRASAWCSVAWEAGTRMGADFCGGTVQNPQGVGPQPEAVSSSTMADTLPDTSAFASASPAVAASAGASKPGS